MIKAIIFDFDGVITESVDIKTEAFAELFKSEGTRVVEDVVGYHLKNTGVSRFDKFKYIYKNILKRELSEETFKRLCDDFKRLVIDKVVKAPYVAGADIFLKNNASAYYFYVASATPQNEIELIIKRREIDGLFRSVYGSPMAKKDAVADILSKEGFKPSSVLYIGDAMSDYVAARENSVKFIARINNNENIFSGIDCLKINDLAGLEKIVKSL